MHHYDQRTSSYNVFGNTADELEAAALKEARKDFGPDIRLEPDRTYELVHKVPITSLRFPQGTNLTASIRIRVVNEPNPAFPEPQNVLKRWRHRWLG